MRKSVDGVYALLNAQIGNAGSLHYIKSIYRDDIDNLFLSQNLNFPLINVEADSMSVDYRITSEERRNVSVNIYIGLLTGNGINIQSGITEKNKKGYIDILNDIQTILKTNISYSGYWIRGRVTNVSRFNYNVAASGNYIKGLVINFTIER